MIVILRLGHRIGRDARISTHCGLVARALGAKKIVYTGEKDEQLLGSIKQVAKNWGGGFSAEYAERVSRILADIKNSDFKERVKQTLGSFVEAGSDGKLAQSSPYRLVVLQEAIPKGKVLVARPRLQTAKENDPNFKPEKYEHVRSGYDESELRTLALNAGFKVVSIQKYFFFVSRYTVRFQQFLYKKGLVILNLIISPLLLILSELDAFFKLYPRGYIVVLKKK